MHLSTPHLRSRRPKRGLLARVAAIACIACFTLGPALAQEPARFLPAPLLAEAESAAHEELRLNPILTQSFLQATAGPAPEDATVELPEEPDDAG